MSQHDRTNCQFNRSSRFVYSLSFAFHESGVLEHFAHEGVETISIIELVLSIIDLVHSTFKRSNKNNGG